MSTLWPLAVLVLIVVALLAANRQPALEPIFRWLPVPLWCYMLPMAAVTLGWLPGGHPVYRALTYSLLPFALGLLLMGMDLPSVIRTGPRILVATACGSMSIVLGAPLVAWGLQRSLPPDAWKGVGTLAATWTGGSMNLLALRTLLQTPDAIFAPLIIVDAVIAYTWMALLVGIASRQAAIDRWLRAIPLDTSAAPDAQADMRPITSRDGALCVLYALGLTLGAQALARWLPATFLVSSQSGWTVLLVTTFALLASLLTSVRQLGRNAPALGYPCLYLVLAGVGAQASFSALWAAPMWIALGAGIAFVHGISMLVTGRVLRLPLGVLATASQANLGGVVSTPLVGAVYEQRLVPVGLLLAIGCNAVGTYLGLLSATVCRWLLH